MTDERYPSQTPPEETPPEEGDTGKLPLDLKKNADEGRRREEAVTREHELPPIKGEPRTSTSREDLGPVLEVIRRRKRQDGRS